MSVMAVILAGGESPALGVLTALRSEAAVPFAGKYRIIDFSLSNCVNSGIYNVAVLTQYQPRSLNEHIGVGKPWDLDRSTGGVRLLQPYQRAKGERGVWQEGTADALRFNLDVIPEAVDDVLILAGDHIYKMDYRPLLDFHHERGADVTLAVRTVPGFDAYRFGMIGVDPEGKVMEYEEKPRRTRSTLASMGIYVFRRKTLVECLTSDAGKRRRNLGGEVLPAMIGKRALYAYPFASYWADVGTVQAYWEANVALLSETPALDLYDQDWVIHTRSEERPAAWMGSEARVEGNLLCDGCRIEGTVVRSIISPGVYVAPGATVRDAIVMNDTVIESGASVDRTILDKRVRIGEGATVGWGDDNTPNRRWPDRLNTGLTLVGKGAIVPPAARLGRNVVVCPHATPAQLCKQRSTQWRDHRRLSRRLQAPRTRRHPPEKPFWRVPARYAGGRCETKSPSQASYILWNLSGSGMMPDPAILSLEVKSSDELLSAAGNGTPDCSPCESQTTCPARRLWWRAWGRHPFHGPYVAGIWRLAVRLRRHCRSPPCP